MSPLQKLNSVYRYAVNFRLHPFSMHSLDKTMPISNRVFHLTNLHNDVTKLLQLAITVDYLNTKKSMLLQRINNSSDYKAIAKDRDRLDIATKELEEATEHYVSLASRVLPRAI